LQITANNVDGNAIKTAIQSSSSVKLSFLNTPLGGPSGNYSVNFAVPGGKLKSTGGQNSIVITSAPVKLLTAGNALNSVAWVHGVQTNFPAAQ
jgi:hypothetical protein